MFIGGPGRFNRWVVSDLGGQLRAALEQFPGVRLIPFGWVAFFIFLYILLIGPGDYFFLKKVLKRMELTWITFPTIVVTVSLLAYYAAYLFKGNDLLVNQVDVVDVDQVDGLGARRDLGRACSARRTATTRCGSSPCRSTASRRRTSRAPARSRPGRRPGPRSLMSWFSSPEDQFGAMGNSSRRFSFGNGGYAYGGYADRGASPAAGGREPPGGPHPDLEHQVRHGAVVRPGRAAGRFGPPAGGDRPAAGDHHQPPGRQAGGRDRGLRQARLPGGHDRPAGDDPGRADAQRPRPLRLSRRTSGSATSTRRTGNPDFRIDRPALLLDAMFHDSESQRGQRAGPGQRRRCTTLDLTGQLALSRPMLVARVSRPGSRLVLDNAPSPPKVDQATLLRVILPLSEAK